MAKQYETFMDRAQDAVDNSKWADWPFMDQTKEILDSYLDDIMKQDAIHAEPMNKLADILQLMKVGALRQLYAAKSSASPGTMKKQQLIDALIPLLTDVEGINRFYPLQSDEQWEYLQIIMEKEVDVLCHNEGMIDLMSLAMFHGYVYMFYERGSGYEYVMPDEIKEAFGQIDWEAMYEEMRNAEGQANAGDTAP